MRVGSFRGDFPAPERDKPSRRLRGAPALALALAAIPAAADEGGVSFWLPGQYASFAAVAPAPGWSLPMQAYGYWGSASGSKPLPRGGQVTYGLDTDFAGVFFIPTWTPKAEFLGGQPSYSLAFYPGWNRVSADVDVNGSRVSRSDSASGFGDLYPTAQLFWNSGVNNWMAYITGDIPVGAYSADRLANLGLGHGAVDMGGAYTYLNTKTGLEFSATAGVTYNFENHDTGITSGVDSHLDFGLSQSLADGFFFGVAGYAYVQLSADRGQPAALGEGKSRVFGIGPQIGYTFQVGKRQIYTNLRGYGEFDARNRPQGGAVFLTVNLPLSTAP